MRSEIFTNICKSWAESQWVAGGDTLGEHQGALWEQCGLEISRREGHCAFIDTLSHSHSRDGMSLNRNYENPSVRSFSVITEATRTRRPVRPSHHQSESNTSI